MSNQRIFVLPLVAVVAGCAAPTRVEAVESSIVACTIWYCDRNGASVSDGKIFYELDLGGAANSGGYRIIDVVASDGAPMSLQLASGDRDELVGRLGMGNSYVGEELEGMRITLFDELLLRTYVLELETYGRVDFWAGPGSVATYDFRVSTPDIQGDDERMPLCRSEGDSTDDWDDQVYPALIFRGDRYDARAKTISLDAGSWFNLACAGTAASKLHLLRHTTAGTDVNHRTTLGERHAMLKMLTADYCGNGTSYTEDGVALLYADHQGWHPAGIDLGIPEQRKRLEAIWNERGAVCIDTPRHVARDMILCPKPRCPADATSWPALGHVASVIPPPE
jgi:hypothetical protein